MSPFLIKICGLSTPETLVAALDAGVDMVGFVFHPKSPRNLTWSQARELSALVCGRAKKVALMVDVNDFDAETWIECVDADFMQLHGATTLSGDDLTETPERVANLKRNHDRKAIKAIGIAAVSDLTIVPAYASIADLILLDAKPPKDAAYPGGHGKTFDWAILKGLDPFMPFMLSGGLTPENVSEAITTVKALGVTLAGVDVSSGVETAPGVKDVEKIKAFIENARSASLKAIA
jgi:phosphoribosylanthranilate isomerase